MDIDANTDVVELDSDDRGAEYIYRDTVEFIDCIVDDYDVYKRLLTLMNRSGGTVSLSKKILQKQIDEGWVSAIEQALPALDRVMRNPGRDIKETEEVLPIELSHNITARSIRHLAQHTDYIKTIENGKITPSKILNVFHDETIDTYENRFINTLIDRLYMFINKRYAKLSEYGRDENSSELNFNLCMDTGATEVKINLTLEAKDKDTADTDGREYGSDKLWQRVQHICRIVSDYKSSPFVAEMGELYVRPPIMRTNVIMKNQYYRTCLNLWQFIESYDKVGYEINVDESKERPGDEQVRQLYSLLALQYIVFRYNTRGSVDKENALKVRKSKRPIQPKFIRSFENDFVEDFNFYEVENKKIAALFPGASRKRLTPQEQQIKGAIDLALAEERKLKAARAKEERERIRRKSAAAKAKK